MKVIEVLTGGCAKPFIIVARREPSLNERARLEKEGEDLAYVLYRRLPATTTRALKSKLISFYKFLDSNLGEEK